MSILRSKREAAVAHLFSFVCRQPAERAARALGERDPLFHVVALKRLEQVLRFKPATTAAHSEGVLR